MKPKRSAHRPRPAITPPDQVVWLRGEVLRLREQESAWKELYDNLDRELEWVDARAMRENQSPRDRNAALAERLLATQRALEDTRAEARAERGLHRVEVAVLRARCRGLATLCDALLDAAEIAFGSEPGAQGPTELPPHAQGSA